MSPDNDNKIKLGTDLAVSLAEDFWSAWTDQIPSTMTAAQMRNVLAVAFIRSIYGPPFDSGVENDRHVVLAVQDIVGRMQRVVDHLGSAEALRSDA